MSAPGAIGNGRRYGPGAVLGLLEGPLLTRATALAIRERLAVPKAPSGAPAISEARLDVLRAAAARLLPQPEREIPIDLVGEFERRLRAGIGDGWRYADQPPDAESCLRGLDLLDAAAQARCDSSFGDATTADQDGLLHDVQSGRIAGWAAPDAARWFEELLAALVDVYYSHPVALDEIGYAGMADARGWQDVGLGARAPHEPEPIG